MTVRMVPDMDCESQEQTATSTATDSPTGEAPSYAKLGAELREYVAYYAAVRLDRVRLSAGRALAALVVAAIAFVLIACFILAATVLTLAGAAAGLGEALGGRLWLGSLLTGAGTLLVGASVLWAALNHVRRTWLTQVRQKYEARRDEQRRRFGHDLAGRV